MRIFWSQPLRRQLILSSLLLGLGPLVGLTIWSSIGSLRTHRTDLKNQAQIVANTIASGLSRDLQYLDAVAHTLIEDPAFRTLDPQQLQSKLDQALVGRPVFLGMAVISRGAVLARVTSATAPAGDMVPLAVEPGVQVVRRAQRAAANPDSQAPAAYVATAYPIKGADGTIAGSLTIFTSLSRLGEALLSLGLPPGSIAVISDSHGQVLAQNVASGRDARRTLFGASGGDTDAPEVLGSDGLERLHIRTLAQAGPWPINIGIPADVAFARATEGWRRTFAVLAISLAACLLGAWFLSRRLSGSLSHLNAAAQRIAAGDFTPLTEQTMRSAEFADLQAAFGRMLKQFNATRSALDAQMAEERRIRKELESLQGQVIQQERLAAVGQLVSGVAHEINNPLQAILGFAELLQLQRDVPESVKTDLQLIQKESARACAIIRNLALFARQQPGEAGPVTMTDVIRSVAELRQRRLESEDIELKIEDRAAKPVKAILTELQQVVLNFVVNAEQAILGSGRLPGRITIRAYDRDGRVVLEVEDTGPGIGDGNEAKLFQPFFTTKPVGQGTGLGLSISYGIIDSLGGSIGHRRAPAGGAIFYFELPATAAVVEHATR
jgi:signal transduction histidine kinase